MVPLADDRVFELPRRGHWKHHHLAGTSLTSLPIARTGIFLYVTLKLSFKIGRGIIDGTMTNAGHIEKSYQSWLSHNPHASGCSSVLKHHHRTASIASLVPWAKMPLTIRNLLQSERQSDLLRKGGSCLNTPSTVSQAAFYPVCRIPEIVGRRRLLQSYPNRTTCGPSGRE